MHLKSKSHDPAVIIKQFLAGGNNAQPQQSASADSADEKRHAAQEQEALADSSPTDYTTTTIDLPTPVMSHHYYTRTMPYRYHIPISPAVTAVALSGTNVAAIAQHSYSRKQMITLLNLDTHATQTVFSADYPNSSISELAMSKNGACICATVSTLGSQNASLVIIKHNGTAPTCLTPIPLDYWSHGLAISDNGRYLAVRGALITGALTVYNTDTATQVYSIDMPDSIRYTKLLC